MVRTDLKVQTIEAKLDGFCAQWKSGGLTQSPAKSFPWTLSNIPLNDSPDDIKQIERMNEDLRLERTLRGTIVAGQNQTHAAKPHEVQQVAQVTLYQCRAENADAGGPMVYSYDITAAIVAVGETVILLHPPLPSVGVSIVMEIGVSSK